MDNRCGVLEVSLELLVEALHLPKGTSIKRVFPPDPWKYRQTTFFVCIEHGNLPAVAEGASLPNYAVEYEETFELIKVKIIDEMIPSKVLVEDSFAR